MLEHLERTWDRCLCEAKRVILDQRLADWNGEGLFPELPTDEDAQEHARQLLRASQASAQAKANDPKTHY
jgi:hypothetical protein